jgi:hypothetical protein
MREPEDDMNASWPIVLAALVAGTLGGFMIPTRPEIRDVPALTAPRAKEPVAKDVTATPAKAEAAADIPNTEQNTGATQQSDTPKTRNAQAEAIPCERQAWPNQTPNCLDRSAELPDAETVPVRRVDPAVSVADKPEPTRETKSKAETKTVAAPSPAPEAAPKPEPAKPEPVAAPKAAPAKPQPKVVSAPPARNDERASQPDQAGAQSARETREERNERRALTQQTATRSNEPRAETSADEDDVVERPRRPARRVTRDELDDGIPTRIYLRGPDGRLYLAPQYRPSGRTIYYVR